MLRRSFPRVMVACKHVENAKTVYNYGESCVASSNTPISTYTKCGILIQAHRELDNSKVHAAASWNTVIAGYAANGQDEMVLYMFTKMISEECEPNTRNFIAAIKSCTRIILNSEINDSAIERGLSVHLLACLSCFDSDMYVKSSLIDMYAKCGMMVEAQKLFDSIGNPDVVSWTSLILGYANNGEGHIALHFFTTMRTQGCLPDGRILFGAIKACTDLATRAEGIEVSSKGKALEILVWRSALEYDVYVKASLIEMYAKDGNISSAYNVFETIQHPNIVCWTALLSGYVDNGEGELALDSFREMKCRKSAPDNIAFTAALKALTVLTNKLDAAFRGKSLHLLASISGFDACHFIQIGLLDMYAKSGNMKEARKVFDSCHNRDLASWTVLMLGYADNGESEKSLKLFSRMRDEGVVPVARTYVPVLKACNHENFTEALERGTVLHLLVCRSGFDSDVFVMNILIDMYAKRGKLVEARNIFERLSRMKQDDVISWSALISGYVNNGDGHEALELFSRMKRQGFVPDATNFLAVLKACSMLGKLEIGKVIHLEICCQGFERDVILVNTLVDFYGKCGNPIEAEKVFSNHVCKDLITWTALMTAYSSQGNIKGVFDLFERLKCTSIQLDGVTFNCLLTACSHAGLVEKGKEYFEVMSKYHVSPGVEHYACMIDILGRANKLDEAMQMLRDMPLEPTIVMWMSVLGASEKWKNMQLGRLAFESLKCLDVMRSGAYILMANTYEV